jgi:hypothetical protein
LQRRESTGSVLLKRVTAEFVPFDNGIMVKAGVLDAQRQTSGTSK